MVLPSAFLFNVRIIRHLIQSSTLHTVESRHYSYVVLTGIKFAPETNTRHHALNKICETKHDTPLLITVK